MAFNGNFYIINIHKIPRESSLNSKAILQRFMQCELGK